MGKMQFREICHARFGDKGDTAIIGCIVYDKQDYEWIKREVTVERVKVFFKGTVKGDVKRYELHRMGEFNFVLPSRARRRICRAFSFDVCGKALGSALLTLIIET